MRCVRNFDFEVVRNPRNWKHFFFFFLFSNYFHVNGRNNSIIVKVPLKSAYIMSILIMWKQWKMIKTWISPGLKAVLNTVISSNFEGLVPLKNKILNPYINFARVLNTRDIIRVLRFVINILNIPSFSQTCLYFCIATYTYSKMPIF